MTEFKNHWTNEKPETLTKIGKFNESEIYKIINVDKIETTFGKRYVLTDENNDKYWPNKAIEKFIHEHKNIKQFKIKTSEFKTFTNKKGEEIRFLDVDIYF